MEDRRQREKQFAEERRLWELEVRRREEEQREERLRWDEEAARKEKEMQEQMNVLKSLVDGIHEQGEATLREQAAKDKDVRVAKLTDANDVEAYLTTFERQMVAYEVPRRQWTFKLAPQLSGKAQQA